MKIKQQLVRNRVNRGVKIVESTEKFSGSYGAVWERADRSDVVYAVVITCRGRVIGPAAFNNRAYADQYVVAQFAAIKAAAEEKKTIRAKRAAHVTSLKVGDILVSSWGWEQTNVDFYQVVNIITGKTIEIRPIAEKTVTATGSMSETVTAVPDEFTGSARRVRVSTDDSIKLNSYKYASKWDGQPEYQSHYA